MSINVYLHPNRIEDMPKSGGVREHMLQLKKHLMKSATIQVLPYRALQMAQIIHVQATYTPILANVPVVFTCHGGFLPTPSPIVIRNIHNSDIIVSVADWIVARFFPQFAYKTVTIPNGVDMTEFENLPSSGLEPGYVLYGKEWAHHFEDFLKLTAMLPKQHFVTVFWPVDQPIPHNVTYIGLQSRDKMKAIIKDAGLLLLTGSEVCPIMLLEAWAAMTPVLAKNIDGSHELMQPFMPNNSDIVGGMLYSTIKEASVFINYVLGDRERLGKQGYRRVVQTYRWEDLIKKYETVYEHTLECVLV